MGGMTWTCFLQCDRCHIECRIDSEAPTTSASSAPLIVRHCPDSEGIPVLGKVTKFQERRGGLWVDVQGWVDAA
jgi:hypothetical protein